MQPVLLVVAAPLEAGAVRAGFGLPATPGRPWRVAPLTPGFRLLETGIGKSNASASVARALTRGFYRAVINLGIAGALPGSGLTIGGVLVAPASIYADEGLLAPAGFTTCSEMGFPLGPFEGNAVSADPALRASVVRALRAGGIGGLAEATVATVSTCSGTDAAASAVRARTGASAEAMEGAAVGHCVARFSDEFPARACPFLEVRVVSNTTGDRASQRWDIRASMAQLKEVARALREHLDPADARSESAPGA